MASALSEYVAAVLIEFGTRVERGISVPIDEVFSIPRVHFDWDVSREQVTEAIEILRGLNIADVSNDTYAGTFIAIQRDSFERLWQYVKSDETRFNEKMIEDDFFVGSEEEMRKFPSLVAIQPFPIIKKYGQFGRSWLDAALENLRAEKERVDGSTAIDSSSWTGRYDVSESDKIVVIAHMRAIEEQIDVSPLTNSQKAEARAMIRAAQALVDSPDPAWAIIVQLLSSPILANVTAIAALAVAVIKGS